MYLSWAAFYEGETDDTYLGVLIPRLIDAIIIEDGIRPVNVPTAPAIRIGLSSRRIIDVATEICKFSDAFHIVFIHADTGGRLQAARLESRREAFANAAHEICGWSTDRCVFVSPRHETEAWALTDPSAVAGALGRNAIPRQWRFPASPSAAERLVDPKATLDRIAERSRIRRHNHTSRQLLTAIAQRQSIDLLRQAQSFQLFEQNLRRTLATLGCL